MTDLHNYTFYCIFPHKNAVYYVNVQYIITDT